jgi:type IV pilus assembly protein PilW
VAVSETSTQRGFTLVEIMIGMVIGLFLTAGIVQMYLANRQSYRFNDALARMQENGRFALETMAGDIRMADFWGCNSDVKTRTHIDSSPGNTSYNPHLHDFSLGLEGLDAETDRITVRGAGGASLPVLGHGGGGGASDPLLVPGSKSSVADVIGNLNTRVARIVLVSDCRRGDIFQVTSLASPSPGGPTSVGFAALPHEGTPGNATSALSAVYTSDARLLPLRVATYEVRSADGEDGLYRISNGNAAEMVKGVRDMQILYGEDGDGDGAANRYVTATDVTNFDAVVSVRVALLLISTEQNLIDAPQPIRFNGTSMNCPERRFCQVMSSTFTIRNRAL